MVKSNKRRLADQLPAIKQMLADGHSKSAIAKNLGYSRQSIYNALEHEPKPEPEPKPAPEVRPYCERSFPVRYHKASGVYYARVDGKTKYLSRDPDQALAAFRKLDLPPTWQEEIDALVASKGDNAGDYENNLKQLADWCAEQPITKRIQSTMVGYRLHLDDMYPNPVTRQNKVRYARMLCTSILERHPNFWGGEVTERKINKWLHPVDSVEIANHKLARPSKFIENHEIHKLLAVCDPQFKAIVLCGINFGFGPADVYAMTYKVAEGTRFIIEPNKAGHLFLDWWRKKKGIYRRAPIWQQTFDAILAFNRPEPMSPEYEDHVFLTRYGRPWSDSAIDQRFKHFLCAAGLKKLADELEKDADSDWSKGGIYSLKYTFRAVAERAATSGQELYFKSDIRCIFGQRNAPDITETYRTHHWDERLLAVSRRVQESLFPKTLEEQANEALLERIKAACEKHKQKQIQKLARSLWKDE